MPAPGLAGALQPVRTGRSCAVVGGLVELGLGELGADDPGLREEVLEEGVVLVAERLPPVLFQIRAMKECIERLLLEDLEPGLNHADKLLSRDGHEHLQLIRIVLGQLTDTEEAVDHVHLLSESDDLALDHGDLVGASHDDVESASDLALSLTEEVELTIVESLLSRIDDRDRQGLGLGGPARAGHEGVVLLRHHLRVGLRQVSARGEIEELHDGGEHPKPTDEGLNLDRRDLVVLVPHDVGTDHRDRVLSLEVSSHQRETLGTDLQQVTDLGSHLVLVTDCCRDRREEDMTSQTGLNHLLLLIRGERERLIPHDLGLAAIGEVDLAQPITYAMSLLHLINCQHGTSPPGCLVKVPWLLLLSMPRLS